MKPTKNTLMSLWSRKAIESKMVVTVAFVALLLSACGESGTTEDVTRVTQSMEVVTDVSQLPSCSANNDGELVWVKGEATPRMCSDGKWYAVAEGSVTATCTTEPLSDGSGVKVLCGGDVRMGRTANRACLAKKARTDKREMMVLLEQMEWMAWMVEMV